MSDKTHFSSGLSRPFVVRRRPNFNELFFQPTVSAVYARNRIRKFQTKVLTFKTCSCILTIKYSPRHGEKLVLLSQRLFPYKMGSPLNAYTESVSKYLIFIQRDKNCHEIKIHIHECIMRMCIYNSVTWHPLLRTNTIAEVIYCIFRIISMKQFVLFAFLPPFSCFVEFYIHFSLPPNFWF